MEELFTENHYRVLASRIHAVGLKFHLESYDGPFNKWEAAACADVPMVEFWLRPVKGVYSGFGGYVDNYADAYMVNRNRRPVDGAATFWYITHYIL